MYPLPPNSESTLSNPRAEYLASPHNRPFFICGGESIGCDPRRPVLAAMPIAGSLGVRGLIDGVAGESLEETSAELRRAVDGLRSNGVRRAHIVARNGSPLGEVAERVGFGARPGEELYVRQLERERADRYPLSSAVVVRDGTVDDLVRLGLTLAEVPELAFAPWEMPLIAGGIGREERVFKVVACEGVVVAVGIGGALADVGTISHLWVDRDHRHLHIGGALCDEMVGALQKCGARSVYLMTTEGNDGANRFWERQGFSRRDDIFFMEIDL